MIKDKFRLIMIFIAIVCAVFIGNIVFMRIQHDSLQRILPNGAKLRFDKGSVNDIEYSPNGTLFAVATTIGILLYDANIDETTSILKGDIHGITTISFSPDGKTLAGGGPDRIVYLWDIPTGRRYRSFVGHRSGINKVLFSRDGKTLVSVDIHGCNLWDIPTGTHKNTYRGLIIKQDTLWLNDDQVLLASPIYQNEIQLEIQLSDLITREAKKRLKGHTKIVKSLSFSPDGQTLASGSYDSTIRLWDIPTGKQKKILKGHKKSINSMSFSRDGNLLASASRDDTVRLWDIGRGKLLHTFKGHTADVQHIVFNADGKTLASVSKDGTVLMWDITSFSK